MKNTTVIIKPEIWNEETKWIATIDGGNVTLTTPELIGFIIECNKRPGEHFDFVLQFPTVEVPINNAAQLSLLQ